jgi:hypothetical protein
VTHIGGRLTYAACFLRSFFCLRCIAELVTAVRSGVNVVLVRKEGARWPDERGDRVCEHPPMRLINEQEECVRTTLITSKAVAHSEEYYNAFSDTLVDRLVREAAAGSSLLPAPPPLLPVVAPAASVKSAPAAPPPAPPPPPAVQGYSVFLAHKRTDAKDFARGLHTLLVRSGHARTFIDFEYDGKLDELVNIVQASDNLVFILSEHVLESPWCAASAASFRQPERACLLHAQPLLTAPVPRAQVPD